MDAAYLIAIGISIAGFGVGCYLLGRHQSDMHWLKYVKGMSNGAQQLRKRIEDTTKELENG